MDFKNFYTKPEIEIIEIGTTTVIASSYSDDLGSMEDADEGTSSYAPKRGFWD